MMQEIKEAERKRRELKEAELERLTWRRRGWRRKRVLNNSVWQYCMGWRGWQSGGEWHHLLRLA